LDTPIAACDSWSWHSRDTGAAIATHYRPEWLPRDGGKSWPAINDTAPNFEAETTEDKIRFHEWIGDKWAAPATACDIGATDRQRSADHHSENQAHVAFPYLYCPRQAANAARW
jgi:hypothetical protein